MVRSDRENGKSEENVAKTPCGLQCVRNDTAAIGRARKNSNVAQVLSFIGHKRAVSPSIAQLDSLVRNIRTHLFVSNRVNVLHLS